MPPQSLTLYTFAISHFSEKIRWTLDASGLDYTEVVMTPSLHVVPALRMGGQGETTLPILRISQTGSDQIHHVQDSTDILEWLDRNRGPLALIPRDLSLNDDIMDIEARFDAIGRDVARYLYHANFNDDRRILGMWTQSSNEQQARLVRLFYPLTKRIFKARMSINDHEAARSALRIQQALAWLDGRLSDGRRYLAGHRFSVADITAASILAPLVQPEQHAIYGSPTFRQGGAKPPAWLGNRPCVGWVKRLYETHRLAPQVHAAA